MNGSVSFGCVLEGGRAVLVVLGQRHPGLDAKNGIGFGRTSSSVRSEWVMPWPATIQFTAPGSIH
jgi:hypothetical protein